MIRRTTWILLAVLAAAIGGYLALRQPPAGLELPLPTPQETAWTLSAEQVVSFRVLDRASASVVVLKRDSVEGWRMLAPAVGPADPGRVEMTLASLLAPPVRQRLAEPEDPAAFGLDLPGRSVTIFLADGTTATLEIGDLDPTGTVYYVRVQGASGILLLTRFGLDDVIGLLSDPPFPPATPTPEPEATVAP